MRALQESTFINVSAPNEAGSKIPPAIFSVKLNVTVLLFKGWYQIPKK